MTLRDAAVWLVATFFLGVGLFGLAAPTALLRPFGLIAEKKESRAEVRAVYGGFGVAMALVLAVAARNASWRPGVVLSAAAALGGMAVGRVVSRAVDGPQPLYPIWFYFWVELLGAGLLAWTLAG